MTRSSKTRNFLSPAHDGYSSRGLRSRIGHRVRRFLGREQSGSVATEFAFALPIFIGLVYGTMQVALVLHANMTLSQAMRDGARFAIVRGAASDTPATEDDIRTAVKNAASLLEEDQINVSVTWVPDNLPGSRVNVAGTYPFNFNIPLYKQVSVTLTASSELTIHN